MNKLLTGAAAVLAVAAPSVASAEITGYVGASYASVDDDDDSNKDGVIGLDGALVTDVGGAWSLQFDAHHGDMDHGGHNDAFSNATAHLFTRNESWAFGGFAGLGSRGGSSFWLAGVEGQFYTSDFTFGAAYTYADERNNDGYPLNAIDLEGAYFLTPNTSIGAGLGWFDDEWEDEDGFAYNLNIEHQLAGSPFSIGAAYFMHDADYSGGGEHEVDGFGIFGRWNLGTADLQTRSREGASMPGGANFVRHSVNSW